MKHKEMALRHIAQYMSAGDSAAITPTGQSLYKKYLWGMDNVHFGKFFENILE
jgi:hypothetical protein